MYARERKLFRRGFLVLSLFACLCECIQNSSPSLSSSCFVKWTRKSLRASHMIEMAWIDVAHAFNSYILRPASTYRVSFVHRYQLYVRGFKNIHNNNKTSSKISVFFVCSFQLIVICLNIQISILESATRSCKFEFFFCSLCNTINNQFFCHFWYTMSNWLTIQPETIKIIEKTSAEGKYIPAINTYKYFFLGYPALQR